MTGYVTSNLVDLWVVDRTKPSFHLKQPTNMIDRTHGMAMHNPKSDAEMASDLAILGESIVFWASAPVRPCTRYLRQVHRNSDKSSGCCMTFMEPMEQSSGL